MGSEDPNTYLVNDTADPLQRSLTCLELTDVLMGAPPPGASATWAPPAGPATLLLNRDSGAGTTDLQQHLHPSLYQLCLSGDCSMHLHQHEPVAQAHGKVAAALSHAAHSRFVGHAA